MKRHTLTGARHGEDILEEADHGGVANQRTVEELLDELDGDLARPPRSSMASC
jgi:hypothetical protein